ncbi:hypothetical protein [Xanthocytophaga agilis]|uniref:Uncharacterized protein n=1 Tax=Xanthocytophaga agilis TaxID=3048010 RepID=A0AAE3RA62_9BACT|nr:hypothetical protein [Xanthocytophaga agilis]MDJ1503602.1 hypothetical protein [Xanthocytophaga agilis]
MLDLTINSESVATIGQSFDRIARELIHRWHLRVNDDLYSFTEIEFYFFKTSIHEDYATHEHEYEGYQWRGHAQGLDMTFEATEDSDGGILIRGLRKDNVGTSASEKYTNGPRRVVTLLFKSLGLVYLVSKQFGLQPKPQQTAEVIHKVKRHGLSAGQKNDYLDALYRYCIEIDLWDIPKNNKSKITTEMLPLE